MRAVAMRAAVAQQEHGQARVKVAIFADLLALIEDRARYALHDALPRAAFDDRHRAIQRRVEAAAESFRPRVVVEVVRGLAAHPDRAARIGDAAAGGEGFEKFLLALDGPAVVTDAARGEVGCWFALLCAHEPYWNTEQGV